MWVTCYADASYSERAGGAWAVWLRSERGRIVRSGACPRYVCDSTLAEFAAIYAGVYLALAEWAPSVRGIFVRSDCQGALLLASPTGATARTRRGRKLQRRLFRLIEEHAVELSCRWVRGHQPRTAGTAAWLNDQCDRMANRRRKAALQAR
jgi:ribonuclease HI